MLDKELELSEDFASEFLSPRLTVVITTTDTKGRANAAPFSYFTPVSYAPPRVCFSVTYRKHNDSVLFHFGARILYSFSDGGAFGAFQPDTQ